MPLSVPRCRPSPDNLSVLPLSIPRITLPLFPCRQTGLIDNACMDLLNLRADPLDEPSWFVKYERPPGCPEVAPQWYPHPPFTIAGAREPTDVYFGRVRRHGLYREAYGVTPLTGPSGAAPTVLRDDGGAVVRVRCRRAGRLFCWCASLVPGAVHAVLTWVRTGGV